MRSDDLNLDQGKVSVDLHLTLFIQINPDLLASKGLVSLSAFHLSQKLCSEFCWGRGTVKRLSSFHDLLKSLMCMVLERVPCNLQPCSKKACIPAASRLYHKLLELERKQAGKPSLKLAFMPCV